jgi:outer membrane protein OmpA-like peptidoglycan-associated protein
MKRGITTLLLFGFVLSFVGVAAAADEDGFNIELFRPAIFGGDFIAFDDADTLKQLGFGFAAYYSYGNSLFSWFEEIDDTEASWDFVSQLNTIHLSAAMGFFDWWNFGVYVPVHMLRYNEFEDGFPPIRTKTEQSDSGVVVGDIAVKMKFGLLQQEKHWLGMALIPYVNFPTGDDEILIGEGRTTGGGELSLEHDFGPIDIGLNGGYLYRGENDLLDTTIADAITYGAGLSHTFDFGLGLGVEYTGRYYSVEETENLKNIAGEVTATVRYQFGKGPRLLAGGGPGGASGIGSPTYRMLAGIDYYWEPDDITDGDLTVLTVDQDDKPISAGIVIKSVGDAGKSGSSDGSWTVTLPAGAYSVEASLQGYQGDTAAATVVAGESKEVKLVLKKLAKTTLTLLVTDKCSGEKLNAVFKFSTGNTSTATGGKFSEVTKPGAYTVTAEVDGYEPKEASFNVVKGQETQGSFVLLPKIKKTGKVFFASGSHKILSKSYSTLNDVVAQIKKVCQFDVVIVEGHTDAQGADAYNMKLSQRRAQAVVDYLVSKGISAGKLQAKPFGETNPVASNVTSAGREQNRRVEFVIK